ncbi:FmdB family zinc ribbon protein [Bifidobacterium canis]|uniref:FmdB family transcriptional regulator n=1 Tax=Bifidobacterium canis TaxID=2610880 RepID=A0A7K1J5A7_9BIFI|nr:FmdB family transcriptional regulator [Bifidobacterium canis]
MPTYHYRCKNCGYDFTKEQSFTDQPIEICPKCGAKQVHKVYSAVPITFKGSGFYRTDSKGSSK